MTEAIRVENLVKKFEPDHRDDVSFSMKQGERAFLGYGPNSFRICRWRPCWTPSGE